MSAEIEVPGGATGALPQLLWRYVATTEDIALFMLDAAGRVIAWNAGAERLTGFAERELRGQTLAAIYPSADVAAGVPARELELVARSGRLEYVADRLRKAGGSFRARTVLAPIRDVAEVLGFVGTINEAVGEHAMPVRPVPDRRVHDLNNIMTILLGNAEALGQRLKSRPELVELSGRIADAAERGAALLKSLFPGDQR